jgi:hypothetical protein
MNGHVHVKGSALAGTIAGLKPLAEKRPDLVPPALQHYLDEEIGLTAWYPFDDYVALLKILASTMDPAKVQGDPYRAFGIIAARRDLLGTQDTIPEEQRAKQGAVYSGKLKGVTGLASLVRRCLHLRELYYSRGYYKVKRLAERKLLVTLHDFPASAELCATSTGYLIGVFRGANIAVWVERLSCRGNGDPDCRWELKFDDKTDVSDLKAFE